LLGIKLTIRNLYSYVFDYLKVVLLIKLGSINASKW